VAFKFFFFFFVFFIFFRINVVVAGTKIFSSSPSGVDNSSVLLSGVGMSSSKRDSGGQENSFSFKAFSVGFRFDCRVVMDVVIGRFIVLDVIAGDVKGT